MIVINFKTYKEVSGKNALKLIDKTNSKDVIFCVQASDLRLFPKKNVFAQHVDFYEPGKTTGFLTIEALKDAGAKGSLINHSEHKLDFETVKKTCERAKELNFNLIACAASIEEAEKMLSLNPMAIAFEVPELISTGNSITEYKGDEVKKFSEIVKNYNKNNKTKILAICGAGVSNENDVAQAYKLGCDGVLFASAIVKTKNPIKLVKAMENA